MATSSLDVSGPLERSWSRLYLTPMARFVTLFWPKKVKAGKLEEIHAKMVMKEGAAPRASSSDGPSAPKKPRLSTSATSVAPSRSTGSSLPSATTSSSHANGKYR